MEPRDPREREDELWREIVANYGERPTLEEPAAGEDADDPAAAVESDGPAAGTEEYDDPDPAAWEDEGRFVPPPPPPIPIADPPRMLAWLGLFGVPMSLLVIVVAGLHVPQWLGLLMVAWFVGGFVYLVKEMPRDPPDPWDDGSRL